MRSGTSPEITSEQLIVGGGIAGLVLARRLALAGRAVRILEASDRLGGQLAPQRIAGVDLDAAAESFATRGGGVAGLLDELGLSGDIVEPEPGPAWVMLPDGAVPLPAAGLLGIPSDLDDPGVARALGPEALARAREDATLGASVGADAETLAELVTARMGRAAFDRLVAPVVRGVHSRDDLPLDTASPSLRAALAERGSLAAAVRALRAAAPAGSLVAGIRGGMFRLADALAAECRRLGVAIETGVAVDRVPDGAVLAAPRPGIPGRAVTLVTLVLDAPALDGSPRGSGLLVAAGAPVAARALTHLSAKWRWVAEALSGRHALRLSYDDAPADPLATARSDAAAMLGVPLPDPVDATVRTWVRPATDDAGGPRVGEPVAGTGLASVIPHAERVAAELLDSRPPEGRERMDP